jgi:hypothetical protein
MTLCFPLPASLNERTVQRRSWRSLPRNTSRSPALIWIRNSRLRSVVELRPRARTDSVSALPLRRVTLPRTPFLAPGFRFRAEMNRPEGETERSTAGSASTLRWVFRLAGLSRICPEATRDIDRPHPISSPAVRARALLRAVNPSSPLNSCKGPPHDGPRHRFLVSGLLVVVCFPGERVGAARRHCPVSADRGVVVLGDRESVIDAVAVGPCATPGV